MRMASSEDEEAHVANGGPAVRGGFQTCGILWMQSMDAYQKKHHFDDTVAVFFAAILPGNGKWNPRTSSSEWRAALASPDAMKIAAINGRTISPTEALAHPYMQAFMAKYGIVKPKLVNMAAPITVRTLSGEQFTFSLRPEIKTVANLIAKIRAAKVSAPGVVPRLVHGNTVPKDDDLLRDYMDAALTLVLDSRSFPACLLDPQVKWDFSYGSEISFDPEKDILLWGGFKFLTLNLPTYGNRQ